MIRAMLQTVDDHGKRYPCLMFVCPGCRSFDNGSGLHMIPVNTNKTKPSWSWNGDLDKPTIRPSMRTRIGKEVCHKYLIDGVFQFLKDCTHEMAGKHIPIPALPAWIIEEEENE